MSAKHAILSPSAAHRWLVCTPSARFEEQIPEQTSEYAEEGTLAHELAALLLAWRAGHVKDEKAAQAKLSEIAMNPLYTTEMYDYAEEYAAYVMELGGEVRIEQPLDLSEYAPLSFGTSDAIVSQGRKMLHVVDFKYGAGKRVVAKENEQLLLYALGAAQLLKMPKSCTLVLHIFQPRAGGASQWEILGMDTLDEWINTVLKPQSALAIAGQGNFEAGKHCGFCKARFSCAAYYRDYAFAFGKTDERELTAEQTRKILLHGSDLAKWLKAFEDNAIKDLRDGKKIEGFKLVAGRGSRTFKSEYDVVETLLSEGFDSEQIYNSKLVSLTMLEKTLGKKRFNELLGSNIIQVTGSPKIVPNSDERGELNGADEYLDE